MRVLSAAIVSLAVMMVVSVAATPAQQRGGGAGAQRAPVGPPRGRGPGASATASRIEPRTYLFPGTNERLEYDIFVSTKVDRKKKNPLVIALHGLGVPPGAFLAKITDAAQDAGYIVAAPTGYNLQGWYGANGPGNARGSASNVGELSEKDVMNVLDLMRKEFIVDDRRIYLAGQSMGGAGALFLGIKHRDIWAAVAASAPAIRTELHTPADLEPATGVPMILIQGDADPAVPVEQTRQWAAKMKELKMTYEYHELPGVGHDAITKGVGYVFAFFDKHVKPADR
jgi:poly(3-hydroxybutyrate) depolymerase